MMISDGVLENPRPLNIIGQHVMPELPAGKIGFHSGMYMASVDEIYLTITGKGGHAAAPHQVIDPVIISSEILVMLQQLVSRRTNPFIARRIILRKIHCRRRTQCDTRQSDHRWHAPHHGRKMESAKRMN